MASTFRLTGSSLILLSACGCAYAQTTFATITGNVTDSSGSVVVNAKITATNVETNIKTTTVSNEAGSYTIAQLRDGTYAVSTQAPGFKESLTQDIVLAARDLRRLDISLEVGNMSTRVEVTAGATLIETETARISDTKNAGLMKTVPLNTRSIWAILALSPDVLQAGGGSSTIRFAGSRGNQSHWAIDGTTMSDGVDETQIGPLANYIESFEEVKIDISNNTAEFGTIGQVTMISKSGTNALHGNGFDYYSTPMFRARDPFALARATGIGHTPGGSVGGPVFLPKLYNGKNRTFFFFSFETSRGSNAADLLNPTVPLAAWRKGDFSGLPGGALIYDPRTGAPFPGNIIPADRINPVSQRIQDRFFPLPNFGSTSVLQSQNYRETKSRPYDPSTYWTTRVDHRFSDKDAIFGRFTFQRLYNRTYEGNLPTIGRRIQQRDNRAASTSYTHTFRPTLLNEFRWGFALNNNPVIGPLNGPQVVKDLGLTGLAPDLPDISGVLKVSFTGLGLTGITQPDYTKPGFRNHLEEFQNHLSWFHGRHSAKFGINWTRVEYDSLNANANLFGALTFSTRFTSGGVGGQGNPYADFLLGIPTTAARAFPPVELDRNRWQYDFFAADDFRINSRLTLNLGIRYELHMPWRENHNLTSMFDINSGNIVVEDGALSKVSALFPKSYASIVEASTLGLPGHTLIRPDRNNVAPRIGLAYKPWGNQTVFRAGYGIFYDVVPRTLNQGGVPFVINEPAYTNPLVNPDVILPGIFPVSAGTGPTTVGIPAAVNPDLKIPYSMQYNFTIQHERWNTGFTLSYIGTNTRQGDWNYNYNSPVPDTRLYINKPRPFPNYSDISYYTNGAGHQYNGLTAMVQRHMAAGIYLQSSWVWARDIYDLNRGEAPENPFDRSRERAVSPDIPTHRFTTNWIYQFPFGRGKHFLSGSSRIVNLAVGGWEVSGIYSLYSGQFLTPMWTGPDTTGTAFTASGTPALVMRRPDQIGDPNLSADARSVNRWFNTAAFVAPQAGRFGSAAKDVIKGPGVNVWHAGVFKEFQFADHGPRLRWELTSTNVFNHPNYSNPSSTDITALSNVGVISSVGGVQGASTGDKPGARVLRTGLRLEW